MISGVLAINLISVNLHLNDLNVAIIYTYY